MNFNSSTRFLSSFVVAKTSRSVLLFTINQAQEEYLRSFDCVSIILTAMTYDMYVKIL